MAGGRGLGDIHDSMNVLLDLNKLFCTHNMFELMYLLESRSTVKAATKPSETISLAFQLQSGV